MHAGVKELSIQAKGLTHRPEFLAESMTGAKFPDAGARRLYNHLTGREKPKCADTVSPRALKRAIHSGNLQGAEAAPLPRYGRLLRIFPRLLE